jgi:hypothetical protein
MMTETRYQSEAAMARGRRATATTDDEAMLHDRVADAYATAARHALLHARWLQTAADQRRAARLGPLNIGGGRGPVDPVAEARGLARAERSAQIAENHRLAAEGYERTVGELQQLGQPVAAAASQPRDEQGRWTTEEAAVE